MIAKLSVLVISENSWILISKVLLVRIEVRVPEPYRLVLQLRCDTSVGLLWLLSILLRVYLLLVLLLHVSLVLIRIHLLMVLLLLILLLHLPLVLHWIHLLLRTHLLLILLQHVLLILHWIHLLRVSRLLIGRRVLVGSIVIPNIYRRYAIVEIVLRRLHKTIGVTEVLAPI